MRYTFDPSANFNPLYYKLRDAKTRFVVNYGGAGSSKSYSQAQNELIHQLRNGGIKTLILRKTGETLKDSVIPLIVDELIPKWGGLKQDCQFNKSSRELTNLRNGSKILFRGLDDVDKLKSIFGISRVWLEEADQFTKEDFKQLNLRLRGFDNIQISLTLNPILETHWIKTDLVDSGRDNITVIKTTYKDNRFIDSAYHEELESYKDTDYDFYRVYALGEWGKPQVDKPFAYAFDNKVHVGKLGEPSESLPLHLSFDFNVDPITCIVGQHGANWIKIFKEFRLRDSNIYELCNEIRTHFPKAYFVVTGDASGNARSAMAKGNLNYYKIIQSELRLNKSAIKVPSVNPSIANSRVLLNAVLSRHPNFLIDESCRYLADDLQYVEVNESGDIDKAKDKHRTHLLDTLRYYLFSFHSKFLNTVRIQTQKANK